MPRPDPNLYAQGIRFACQGCGSCCLTRGRYGYVYVSLPERRRLARHLRLPVQTFTRRHCVKKNEFFHLRSLGAACVFLENNRCRVHKARPDQCRTWPFWPENMNPKTWTRDILPGCPGIGRGPLVAPRKIRACLRQETARAPLR